MVNNPELNKKELEKLEHLKSESKPLWITKQQVERPWVVCGISCVVFLVAFIITIAGGLMALTDGTSRDWYVWEHAKVLHHDMYESAVDVFKEKLGDQQMPARSQEMADWSMIFIQECRDDCDDVLTPEGFEFLLKIENGIQKVKNYNAYCKYDANNASNTCDPEAIDSITSLLTPAQRESGKLTQAEIDALLDRILQEDEWSNWSYKFHKDFNTQNRKSKLLSWTVTFASPIQLPNGKVYKDRYDNEKEQEEKFTEFAEDLVDFVDKLNEDKNGGIEVIFTSEIVANIMFNGIIIRDNIFALVSIIFVWCYMTFHLKSFWLSSMSMLGVIMSFPLTLVIFRGILQIDYFSFLHILVIFIILGIAADDVFVFFDAWNQTKQYDFMKADYNLRMAVTFRRAAKAMLATSFTTSAAFLATAFSDLMPITSFGIFSSILVPMNYLLVITYFPSLLIIAETKFNGLKCCLCCGEKPIDSQPKPVDVENNYQTQDHHKQTHEVPHQESKIEVFFGTKFNDFIFKLRYPIIIVFFIWMIVATIIGLGLGPLTQEEKWLPDDYSLQRIIDYTSAEFHSSGSGGNNIEVIIYWGTKKLDKDDVGAWEAEDAGKVIWDNNFNLAPVANQQYLYQVCQDLKTNPIVLTGVVECFMEDFRTYMTQTHGANSFPVVENEFIPRLKEFIAHPLGQPHFNEDRIGLVKDDLLYVSLLTNAIGKPADSYKKHQKIEKKWQDLVEDLNKNAPQGLDDAKQQSATWAWMISQEELVNNAIQGMFISIGLALVVLIIFTGNIIVSLYSVLSIAGIVASVTTVMKGAGWQLGVSESIALVVLIGMAVDYVVHLANHYVESTHSDKYTRMQESLREIGISIISGAVTTLGAGLVLFFCTIKLYTKFAVLIVSTISFSLLFSMFFFAAMMHAFGPQGDFGNLKNLFKKQNKVNNSDKDRKEDNTA